jgi:hypothetical protein
VGKEHPRSTPTGDLTIDRITLGNGPADKGQELATDGLP